MPAKKPRTRVESVRHKDKRANIPTSELERFVGDEARAPRKLRWPRDPSLDPQLVWKGKDEEDARALEVPALPIYIQEKIHPHAIIEDLRREARAEVEAQASLFSDFNGIQFEELVDFYRHEQNWSNRMILGDSLLVMASLAHKENLKGKVQMIYVDPPYGIKFGSNWQVSTRKRDVKDGKAEDVTRQPEQVKAFRDTWELGINSYLSYLRDRFVVARDLLTESGSIFVQIGEDNAHLLRSLLDEVFGVDNFCTQVAFVKTTGAGSPAIGTLILPRTIDYILWYARDKKCLKYRQPLRVREAHTIEEQYTMIQLADETCRRLSTADLQAPATVPTGRRFMPSSIYSDSGGGTTNYLFRYEGTDFPCLPGYFWRTNQSSLSRVGRAGRLIPVGRYLRFKMFADDYPVVRVGNYWDDVRAGGFGDAKVYVVQTNHEIVARCVLMTSDPGDLVMDPTCGSGTTAFVAEQWGRRWITVDTSRVALALARTRLMAAKFPYFLLLDSGHGQGKLREIDPKAAADLPAPRDDVRRGFVYKRVPHVTLKSIANNDEIDIIHARYEEKLAPLLAQLDAAANSKWQEWEVPRETDASWPEKTRKLHAEWWALRRARQRDIDQSIAKRADTELLYDQPYDDKSRIRVTGPFTVESLSPHRVLSPDDEQPLSTREGTAQAASRFVTTILDNLRKAGVQNTVKNERLSFERLEPFPGVWIQGAGEYVDKGGKRQRVAISLGPEHGTVGPEQVKEAAKEAQQGAGFDVLVVCGFAFDAHAPDVVDQLKPAVDAPPSEASGVRFALAERVKQYGKLTVLLARMNPDLSMGDELLKKTGAGNLFTVFGEPDIRIDRAKDGTVTVSVYGVDVYDPTTGEIRSHTTDEVACWFIDTAYNGESFFVRHAYFTGAGEPYEKLRKALRAEIDEAAWASLYSTKSRPFAVPKTGRIAVKVINHYGDEVMKVYRVG
jgi:adenine-specific DNA-methyltransferase